MMNKKLLSLLCLTALSLSACNDDDHDQFSSPETLTVPTLISFAKLPVSTYAEGPDSGAAVSGANGIYPPFKGQPVSQLQLKIMMAVIWPCQIMVLGLKTIQLTIC